MMYEDYTCIHLNFDVYRSYRTVYIDPRGYQYMDCPLQGSTSVLTSYRAIRDLCRTVTVKFDCYRGVPIGTPRILIVINAYQLLTPGIFGGFSILFQCIAGMPSCTIGTSRYIPYRARLGTPVWTKIKNLESQH